MMETNVVSYKSAPAGNQEFKVSTISVDGGDANYNCNDYLIISAFDMEHYPQVVMEKTC
jgi:hypothetical protein